MHLLIPFAYCLPEACSATLAGLELPNLAKLLSRLDAAESDFGAESSLSPPHERALGAAYGISAPKRTPDGLLPWGAWHAAQAGHPVAPNDAWAVITPCHWAVQSSHITMVHPRVLGLQEEESRALLAVMQPYFSDDGIALLYDTPTRWLAHGAVFAGLPTASPYRVLGARVDDWIPSGEAAKTLRRLQQEMQMLLYTDPLTDARTSRGLLAINSFWVSGTGPWPGGSDASARSSAQSPDSVIVVNTLRDAAIQEDWSGWAAAWRHIDSQECRNLLAASLAGQPVRLTLCGEQAAQTFQTATQSALGRLRRQFGGLFGRLPPSEILKKL